MPRKKIPEFAQEPEEELEWDKKKIAIVLIALLLLIVGAIVFRKFILGDSTSPASSQKSVQGASTVSGSTSDSTSLLPSQDDIKQQLKNLEDQVSHLSVKEVASSSPQVQQVLQQIQQLPQLPSDVAKQTCEQLCGKL